MKIEVSEGKAYVYTPYNSEFVSSIKSQIGGAKWNSTKRCWVVPEDMVDVVRSIMEKVYGYSDIGTNETVSLKLTFNEMVSVWHDDVVCFGKIIAHATGRDSGARIGKDVALVEGEAISDGSAKNWYSTVTKGTVVILRNVNKNLYEKCSYEDIEVELLEEKTNKTALMEEKERLLKRLEEIEKLLSE